MSFQNPVFIPGPTNMPEVLRKACDMPTIDHRSPLFGQILHPALAGVKKVLKSERAEIFIFPSTGTGGWETALTNTLSAGDKVLAARNGMFSHRWIDMCNRHGLNVEVVEAPWGAGLPADRYEEILTADNNHEIKVVLATHNETATGVKSDIAAVRRALDAAKHPAMLFVDGVSSIGSMDFRMDEWGVDIAVTGSQKGFMLPAGLAIIGFSPRAMKALETATLPRTFFDVRDMAKGYANNAYPYTPAVGLMNGLKMACDMLLGEGLENVFARHTRIATGVRAAVDAWGLTLCAQSPDVYSDTVSAIRTPDGFNCDRYRFTRGKHIRRCVRCRVGRGCGQGVPHRPSGQPDRRHDAVWSGHRGNGDGRSGTAGQTRLGRCRRAGALPRDRCQTNEGSCMMKDGDTMYIPTFADMLVAHERVKPYIHRTPVLTSQFINELTGADLFFKCENFQKAGAFKVRGASNAVFGLTDEQAAKGVATHSCGNHGTCLSYAAGRRGIPCTVVMPRTAPQAKKDAVSGYGGRVVECEPSTTAARRSLPRSWPKPGLSSFIPTMTTASSPGRAPVRRS